MAGVVFIAQGDGAGCVTREWEFSGISSRTGVKPGKPLAQSCRNPEPVSKPVSEEPRCGLAGGWPGFRCLSR